MDKEENKLKNELEEQIESNIIDNEKDLLYLLPDTKKYPYFEEVYILEKVN